MAAGGEELNVRVVEAVDQTMLVVDATGPVSGGPVLQRFRLAGSGAWISRDFEHDAQDPDRRLQVCTPPQCCRSTMN